MHCQRIVSLSTDQFQFLGDINLPCPMKHILLSLSFHTSEKWPFSRLQATAFENVFSSIRFIFTLLLLFPTRIIQKWLNDSQIQKLEASPAYLSWTWRMIATIYKQPNREFSPMGKGYYRGHMSDSIYFFYKVFIQL